MKSPYPVVGIAVDVKSIEGNPFHAVGEKYINAIAHGCRCYPVLLPAMGKGSQLKDLTALFEIEKLISSIDGLFLPGSVSNVNPVLYGKTLETPELPVDHQRDNTTLTMIRSAVDLGVPLLAVCRGFQELNVAFGGTIHQKVHELPGHIDHREDASQAKENQYRHAHEINIVNDGLLHRLWGNSSARVNSLHGQGIDMLGEGLKVEARAADLLIEAVSVRSAKNFALGVQWHPEWGFWKDRLSAIIFEAFGKAVNQRYRSHKRMMPGTRL